MLFCLRSKTIPFALQTGMSACVCVKVIQWSSLGEGEGVAVAVLFSLIIIINYLF